MRIFFIVVAAVMFADFVEGGFKDWNKVFTRITERAAGMTEEQFTEQYLKEHPKTIMPLVPYFWLAVVIVGFLWAVFWR